MKKEVFILAILLSGLSYKSFAEAGYANDGLEFSFIIIGMLLLVAVILTGINWTKKNSRIVIRNTFTILKQKIILIKGFFNKRFVELRFQKLN